MRIVIETIPHGQQRYPTSGDWELSENMVNTENALELQIAVRVSAMGDWRYEALVGIHEAVEALLCRQAGVKEEDVTAFDSTYELTRATARGATMLMPTATCGCTITEESEPGDDFHAPYYKQHQIATGVERILAAELGVDWGAYEQANLNLYR